ncbi:hypothetical protein [Singulisphaera acidiphila]|uniref:hypothetical protein n=1 Tax=Singulisphaera acidiphila TaxID=466153 RepID=UPI0002472C9B|nr:hypothetical protein [Singulisphaera acidiphila]
MSELSLRAVAFPTLDDTQVARLGHCAGAALKTYRAGQTLFQVGDRDFKFFVVSSARSRSWTIPARRRRRSRSTALGDSPGT